MLADMLETQFYLHVSEATYRDYLKLSLAFSKMMKGGSPQLWRLISRELANGYKEGHISQAEAQELYDSRMTAKSAKFFLTQKCLSEMGFDIDA